MGVRHLPDNQAGYDACEMQPKGGARHEQGSYQGCEAGYRHDKLSHKGCKTSTMQLKGLQGTYKVSTKGCEACTRHLQGLQVIYMSCEA